MFSPIGEGIASFSKDIISTGQLINALEETVRSDRRGSYSGLPLFDLGEVFSSIAAGIKFPEQTPRELVRQERPELVGPPAPLFNFGIKSSTHPIYGRGPNPDPELFFEMTLPLFKEALHKLPTALVDPGVAEFFADKERGAPAKEREPTVFTEYPTLPISLHNQAVQELFDDIERRAAGYIGPQTPEFVGPKQPWIYFTSEPKGGGPPDHLDPDTPWPNEMIMHIPALKPFQDAIVDSTKFYALNYKHAITNTAGNIASISGEVASSIGDTLAYAGKGIASFSKDVAFTGQLINALEETVRSDRRVSDSGLPFLDLGEVFSSIAAGIKFPEQTPRELVRQERPELVGPPAPLFNFGIKSSTHPLYGRGPNPDPELFFEITLPLFKEALHKLPSALVNSGIGELLADKERSSGPQIEKQTLLDAIKEFSTDVISTGQLIQEIEESVRSDRGGSYSGLPLFDLGEEFSSIVDSIASFSNDLGTFDDVHELPSALTNQSIKSLFDDTGYIGPQTPEFVGPKQPWIYFTSEPKGGGPPDYMDPDTPWPNEMIMHIPALKPFQDAIVDSTKFYASNYKHSIINTADNIASISGAVASSIGDGISYIGDGMVYAGKEIASFSGDVAFRGQLINALEETVRSDRGGSYSGLPLFDLAEVFSSISDDIKLPEQTPRELVRQERPELVGPPAPLFNFGIKSSTHPIYGRGPNPDPELFFEMTLPLFKEALHKLPTALVNSGIGELLADKERRAAGYVGPKIEEKTPFQFDFGALPLNRVANLQAAERLDRPKRIQEEIALSKEKARQASLENKILRHPPTLPGALINSGIGELLADKERTAAGYIGAHPERESPVFTEYSTLPTALINSALDEFFNGVDTSIEKVTASGSKSFDALGNRISKVASTNTLPNFIKRISESIESYNDTSVFTPRTTPLPTPEALEEAIESFDKFDISIKRTSDKGYTAHSLPTALINPALYEFFNGVDTSIEKVTASGSKSFDALGNRIDKVASTNTLPNFIKRIPEILKSYISDDTGIFTPRSTPLPTPQH